MNTRYLDPPGGRLAYDDQGTGQVVTCVPGMGDIRSEYRLLTPQLLAAGYRVVTLDLRGHGESSAGWREYSAAAVARDVIALARALDAGPAVIVGTSMAAGSAVCVAADAPGLVAGAGHYPHAEMPAVVGAMIVSFLSALREVATHGA